MNWVQANRKVALVVGLTAAVPLMLVVYWVISLWTLGLSLQGEIETLEPRIARLIGARQAQEELLAASEKARSTVLNRVYPASDDPDAVSAALQKNARSILTAKGLVVADSRIQATRREGSFDVIGLTVSVTGGIDELDAALNEFVSYTPLLLVSDIEVMLAQTSTRRGADVTEQLLTVKMQLLALRGVE